MDTTQPTVRVSCRREPVHIGTGLRQDDPRRQRIDAGDSHEERDQASKGDLAALYLLIHPVGRCCNLLIDVANGRIRKFDVLHVEVQQKAMMECDPAVERLAQLPPTSSWTR